MIILQIQMLDFIVDHLTCYPPVSTNCNASCSGTLPGKLVHAPARWSSLRSRPKSSTATILRILSTSSGLRPRLSLSSIKRRMPRCRTLRIFIYTTVRQYRTCVKHFRTLWDIGAVLAVCDVYGIWFETVRFLGWLSELP